MEQKREGEFVSAVVRVGSTRVESSVRNKKIEREGHKAEGNKETTKVL